MSYLPNKEIVSTDNSSTDTIADGANFTGTWEDTQGYSSVKVAVKTDQDGYYELQWSPDGTNQDSTLTRQYRTSQIEPPHKFENMRRYFRVVFYNNSGSAQTLFRLQTTFSNSAGLLNAPLDGTLSQDYDSISTRPSNNSIEVALGRRQGHTTWNKFGYNEDVDAAGAEVIAEFGGTFQYLTAGETIDIVSSSTNDVDTTGTGVRKLVLYGIDENWDSVTEIVNMNGTTTVTTSTQWIGINRATIYQSGSLNSNDGKVTITANTSGYTMATMPAGQGTTQQCIFYVPRDHQFLATWMHLNAIKTSGGGSPNVRFNAYVYSNVVDSEFEVYRSEIDTGNSEHVDVSPSEPFVIGEKSIFWLVSSTSANNTEVQGRFSGELIRDSDAV